MTLREKEDFCNIKIIKQREDFIRQTRTKNYKKFPLSGEGWEEKAENYLNNNFLKFTLIHNGLFNI